MPTIFSHPAVPLAVGMGLGRKIISTRLLILGVAVSALPDTDVIGFGLGVDYGSDFGHRGFTHSLSFALAVALIGAIFHARLHSTFTKTFCFLALATASHGILDSFTNGGRGVALLWPFSSERFFAPFRPIEVSPIGVSRMFTERFARILESELVWVWMPCVALAVALAVCMWWLKRKSIGRAV